MKISESSYTGTRVSVISGLPFEEVVRRFDALIGHPVMRESERVWGDRSQRRS
jgi:hypothetical protein